jgi:hypothetical protein
MKSIDLLRAEATQKRLYQTRSNIFDKIDSLAALFQQRYPELDWTDCRELLSDDDSKTGNYDFAVRHIIKWGRADARIIEDAFQISLPPCVHELYSQIQAAVLIWRNVFHLLPPSEVVAWELQNRAWLDMDLNEPPIQFVRLMKCESASGDIAIKRSAKDNKWRVFHISVDHDSIYTDDPLNDQFPLSEDLDSWLQYLIENDGAFSPEVLYQEQAAYLIDRIGTM